MSASSDLPTLLCAYYCCSDRRAYRIGHRRFVDGTVPRRFQRSVTDNDRTARFMLPFEILTPPLYLSLRDTPSGRGQLAERQIKSAQRQRD
jgi:hypothetical protein